MIDAFTARWPLTLALAAALLAAPATLWAQADPPPADPNAPEGATTGNDLIEIPIYTGEQRMLTPMAVPEAINLGSADPEGFATWIGETMRNCFSISGYFNVYGPDAFFFDASAEGMTESQISFSNWYNVGAQILIKTAFSVDGDEATVDFRVYNVDGQQQVDIGYESGTVEVDDVRGEVYDFINTVIEYYTGERGIFGSRIVMVGRGRSGLDQIYTIGMDGTGLSTVTENDTINTTPSWGPNGTILYTSYLNGNPDLFMDDQPLSARDGLNLGGTLSPDGEEIAIVLSMDGNSEIYILDLQGDIVRRCTENLAEDVSPVWSPSGGRIAFVSDRSGGPQIYVMNSDCTGQRRVTFAGRYNTTPSWHPNGSTLAFTGRDSRNRMDIFTVEVGSGYITRLTQDQGNNEEPSFSPDGRYVVFQSDRGSGNPRLFVMTADGEVQTPITQGTGYRQPTWYR